MDPSLPPIAQHGSASTFGLADIDRIDGTRWRDWRASLMEVGCAWVVPIIEEGLATGDVATAVRVILDRRV
jgi:hypothetical protein